MTLVYINAGLSSVFESQVLDYLRFIQRHYTLEKVVLLCGYRNRGEKLKIHRMEMGALFTIYFFRYFPNYPAYNYLNIISLLFTFIRIKIISNKDFIFHIRGELTALYATRALRICGISLGRVLADIRGTGKEEIEEFRYGNNCLKRWKIKNYVYALNNLRAFKNVSAVSPSLKNYLVTVYNIPEKNVSIVPCLAGERFVYNENDRSLIRTNLGLEENEILVVFSSKGEAIWQNSSMLEKLNFDGFKILNLSTNKLIHRNIINCFVPYEKVPSYLCAADAGIIFRGASPVNKVASPVKFSEYVCMGLPVISNTNVEIIKSYIESTGYGVIINEIEELNQIDFSAIRSFSRERIIKAGVLTFSVEKISKDYFSIYERMRS